MKLRFATVIALVAAFLIMPITALAANDAGTVTGTIRSSTGAPVPGAQVTLTGPTHQHTTSDANGSFTFATVTAGIYHVRVSKEGYISANLDSLTVLGGGSQPLNVTLQQADLTSLRTIATVSTSIGSSINTGSAISNVVSAQQIQDVGNPQITDVLQTIPGANIERGGSSPNTEISLGGAAPYETQVLLDGHPLSVGRYGSINDQFTDGFSIGGIETEIGPGNTTPFAGDAIGGTANILSPGFTSHPTAEILTGMDSYGSQYTDLLTTGRLNKLSYVVGAGYNANNGPLYGTQGCVVTPSNSKQDNKAGSEGIIQYCGDLSGALWTRGETLKLNYDFSPVTSFQVGYIGSQAGYYPQGSAYGQMAQNILIVPCIKPTECSNPNDSQYIGQHINGYIQYPGSNVFNDMPIWEGQFRTMIGDNTLLIRPYAGSILRDIDGGGESAYPDYYSQTASSSCATEVKGEYECPQSPYTTFELDHLHGTTVSLIHPIGDSSDVTATYDYHSDDTYAQAGDPDSVPFPVVVPNTLEKFNIFSLTGDFAVARNLTLKAGAYDTSWSLNGEQAEVAAAGSSTATLAPLTVTKSHFDPHVGFIFQPTSSLSYRIAYGTSVNFPYAGDLSGVPYVAQPSATAPDGTTLVGKNPLLQPETASEFNIGADKRFHNGAVLSLDLLDMQISNVIETLTTQVNLPAYTYQDEPINAARLSNQMALLTYSFRPRTGFGYYVTGSLQKSIVSGVPLEFYSATAYSQPANGQQQCGNICIPYLKAYGSLNYMWADHTYAEIAADFEGKNNSYDQPPFVFYDLAIRRPISRNLEADISVENILNNNTYTNLVLPNAGVAQVGESAAGLGSVATALLPAPPRTLRADLKWHI